jgi:hypothetical protein
MMFRPLLVLLACAMTSLAYVADTRANETLPPTQLVLFDELETEPSPEPRSNKDDKDLPTEPEQIVRFWSICERICQRITNTGRFPV